MHRKLQRQSQRQVSRRARWTPCASRARYEMISRGLTYERLTQELQARGVRGASMAAVVRVIQGRAIVPYLREALAAYFNQPVEALWPEQRRVA